jgi:hypothetical protein
MSARFPATSSLMTASLAMLVLVASPPAPALAQAPTAHHDQPVTLDGVDAVRVSADASECVAIVVTRSPRTSPE